jgi:transcriptional regulator with XRE-family HTH domain
MDYRDQLETLFRELHDTEGLSRYRIAKRAGITEQTIASLSSKRSNLSMESLQRVLDRLGYAMRFEPLADITPEDGTRRARFVKE